MGDELHNRPNALSALVGNALAPELVKAGVATEALIATLYWLRYDEFLGLGISMAAAKASVEPAEGVELSTLVTAMARNGTEFGIRVSGLAGAMVHRAGARSRGAVPARLHRGGRRPRHGRLGDHRDHRLGWVRPRRRPGILALVGGTPEEALQISRDMRQITLATSPDYRMPVFGFEGAPVGIDIRKVVKTGILPTIDTAIAHREPGHSKIGGGLVRRRSPASPRRSSLSASVTESVDERSGPCHSRPLRRLGRPHAPGRAPGAAGRRRRRRGADGDGREQGAPRRGRLPGAAVHGRRRRPHRRRQGHLARGGR